mmetsp:Transcript_7563/g.18096  ORF Transcript_7563/g.18096 Transcript_7563/m.18096 type:complete len:196 (-) Transcript_7563:314-901(-)
MSSRRRSQGGGGGRGGGGGAGTADSQARVTRVKIMSMGPAGAGKSCLIKRFCEQRFVSKYISTIGVDYGVKPHTVDGNTLKMNFWDLSGQPEFFDVRNEFYKDAQGCVLVFDVTDQSSFDALDGWVQEAKKYGLKSAPVVVCANKVDLKRAITEREGREWAESYGYAYYETSAQSGANVNEVFEYMFDEALKRTR